MANLSQEVVSEDVVMVPDLQAALCIFSVGVRHGTAHLQWAGKHEVPCSAKTPCDCRSMRLTVGTAVACRAGRGTNMLAGSWHAGKPSRT